MTDHTQFMSGCKPAIIESQNYHRNANIFFFTMCRMLYELLLDLVLVTSTNN